MSDLESTLFYATNHGTTPVDIVWAKQHYVLPADGKPRPVPVEPLKMALGNWSVKDTEYVRYRSNEVRRLSMQYATYGAPWYSDDPSQMTAGIVDAGEKIHPYDPAIRVDGRRQFMHPNLPRISVTDLDGNRVFTVIDDPDLAISGGAVQGRIEQANADAVKNEMLAMEHKMNALLETLTSIAPDAAADFARRMNVGKVKPLDPTPADDLALDPMAEGAMDIMNAELGLLSPEDADIDDDTPPATRTAPPAAKKAAAKKAPAPRPTAHDED